MTTWRVAGYQMSVGSDIKDNAAAIGEAIEWTHQQQADILLTPEGALSGYTPHFDPTQVAAWLADVTALARACRVGLALGTCFQEADGNTYNQLRFYHASGEYLGFHSKLLRCGTMTESPEGEINDYATVPLRTFDYDGMRIGGLICNDMWANPACTPMPDPHLSQQLAALGARIIFHAVNGGRNGSDWSTEVTWNFHAANLQLRAAAGKVWIVTVDNANPVDLPCSAPSGVINPQGEWVCRAEPQGEQAFVFSITIP